MLFFNDKYILWQVWSDFEIHQNKISIENASYEFDFMKRMIIKFYFNKMNTDNFIV